jgi:p38 MAP kinase
MKPFSTPVLAKRTYRELKLLKHLKHENVRPATPLRYPLRGRVARALFANTLPKVISLSDIFISPLEDM